VVIGQDRQHKHGQGDATPGPSRVKEKTKEDQTEKEAAEEDSSQEELMATQKTGGSTEEEEAATKPKKKTRKRRKKKGRRDLTRESSSGTSNGLSTQSSVSDTTSVGAVVFGSKRGRGGK